MEIEWRKRPTTDYPFRWVAWKDGKYDPCDPRELRIIKTGGRWEIRFDGQAANAVRSTLPEDTPLEEVQAVAIAIWRMR